LTRHTRRLPGRFSLTLIRSKDMEMFVAHPAALPPDEVAVPFTIDDSFYDDIGDSLPDCSVAFLHRAGAWSARTSHSGFVPAQKLPRFSDDPRTAMRALQSAGIAEWVSGGVQIHEGNGITIVNADESEAEAKRIRDAARERKRNSRAKQREKLNASVNDVTCDIPARSHVTPQIDRSDLDQSSSGVGHVNARARESPELVTAVADAICAKVGYVPTDDQVLDVIAIIRERARKAGNRIRSALAYIPAAIANEPDLWDGLLLPKPPPKTELALSAPSWDPERHEYEPAYDGGPCRCSYTKSSPRHNVARAV